MTLPRLHRLISQFLRHFIPKHHIFLGRTECRHDLIWFITSNIVLRTKPNRNINWNQLLIDHLVMFCNFSFAFEWYFSLYCDTNIFKLTELSFFPGMSFFKQKPKLNVVSLTALQSCSNRMLTSVMAFLFLNAEFDKKDVLTIFDTHGFVSVQCFLLHISQLNVSSIYLQTWQHVRILHLGENILVSNLIHTQAGCVSGGILRWEYIWRENASFLESVGVGIPVRFFESLSYSTVVITESRSYFTGFTAA